MRNNKELHLHKVYDGSKINLPGWKLPVIISPKYIQTNYVNSTCIIDQHECTLIVPSRYRDSGKEYQRVVAASYDDGLYIITDREKAQKYHLDVEVKHAYFVNAGESWRIDGDDHVENEPFYYIDNCVLKSVSEVEIDSSDCNKVIIDNNSARQIDDEATLARKLSILQQQIECAEHLIQQQRELQKYHHRDTEIKVQEILTKLLTMGLHKEDFAILKNQLDSITTI